MEIAGLVVSLILFIVTCVASGIKPIASAGLYHFYKVLRLLLSAAIFVFAYFTTKKIQEPLHFLLVVAIWLAVLVASNAGVDVVDKIQEQEMQD